MKRALTLTFTIIFTLFTTILGAITIKGRVTAGTSPLPGVVVTDGYGFTVTDTKGRYTLQVHEESGFVYISTPAGYSNPVVDGVTKFFIPLERESGKKSYDFNLNKKQMDDNHHGFVVVADPQIYAAKEFPLLERGVDDIKATISAYNIPFHGLAPGDLISHDHTLYPQYNSVMAKAGIPFYNAMGNHDMVNYGRSFETTQWKFGKMFGPSYYSFNVGKIHYVVLNDCFYVGRDYYYIGYLEERQLSWLERDLAYLPKGSSVVVTLHIPTTLSKKDRDKFSYEKSGSTMANHKGLYKILEPFKTHIISGHMHTNHNEVISGNLFEHVTAAMSGAWWQGELCTDGTPKGYGLYIASGDSLSWYYKSVGKPLTHQMRLFTGEDDQSFGDYVVANVWNYDPLWRVELWEDGALTSAMEQFETYDPQARDIYSDKDKLEHKWIYPTLSNNFFRAKPKSENSEVEVVVTDRFGNVYREKLRSRTHFDVVIIGGGASGTAAGIKAASMGARTLIVEEFDWLGGMLTSSGVSAADGNHKLRGGIWGRFRDSLEKRYGGVQGLKSGWVSNTLFEPSVGAKIFANMAAKEPRLKVWFRSTATQITRAGATHAGHAAGQQAEHAGEAVGHYPGQYWSLTIERNGKPVQITSALIIDATELGDVAKKLGVKYDIGMDSRYITGEEIAPEQENDIIQDLTYVMVLKDYGKDMTISKPKNYNPSLFYCSTISKKCKNPKEKQRLWSPEMMITYGKLPNNKYMINWPIEGNDYYTNILEMTSAQRAIELEKSKEHSLAFLYYIQTELGYKNLALADDEFPTADRFPFIPYHRESRRIDGLIRFTINDISDPYGTSHPAATSATSNSHGSSNLNGRTKRLYRTAIAVGDYPVDHHHTRYEGWEALPDLHFYPVPSYGLPLGTLIPKDVDGLIVAEKSISVTNLVNGTTRLQPVVLQIGEAAGALAALAIKSGQPFAQIPVAQIPVAQIPVRDVQRAILDGGGYLLPYLDLPAGHPHFKAIQRIGVTGIIKGVGMNKGWENQTWFQIDSLITIQELQSGLNDLYNPNYSPSATPPVSTPITTPAITPATATAITATSPVTPATLANLIQIYLQTGNIQTGNTGNILKLIEKEWNALSLKNFAPDKKLTRLECALLIDKILNPFDNIKIDITGSPFPIK